MIFTENDRQDRISSLSPADHDALAYAEAMVGELSEMMKGRNFPFIAHLLAMAAQEIRDMGRDSAIDIFQDLTLGQKAKSGAHMAALEEASRVIFSATDRGGLFDAILALGDLLGLEHIAYHGLRLGTRGQEAPYFLLSYDPSWVSRYIDQDYFAVDPVVCAGARQVAPFDWGSLNRQGSRTKALFAEAEKYGVGRQGITIPIRGPDDECALFTVTSNASDEEWDSFGSTTIRTLTEIGQRLHDRVASVEGTRQLKPPSLSPREQQCMQMMARGDVPKQMAKALGLSASAVRLYLHSAKCKLASATLHQAIARAVAFGIISS